MSRHALAKLLTLSGYKISCAATFAEAEIKLQERPRCLILDLNLPDGTGSVLLRKVRMENLPIQVAVTTAATDPALLAEIQQLRPDAFLRKPVNIADLLNWLDAAVKPCFNEKSGAAATEETAKTNLIPSSGQVAA